MLAIGKKIQSCKWVDDGAIFSKAQVTKVSEAHVRAPLDDDSQAYTFTAQESVRGDTFAHSLINPETGEAWKEGEKEQHLQNAIAVSAQPAKNEEDDESIASGESAGWEEMQLTRVEIEGMEEVGGTLKDDLDVEMENDDGYLESNELGKELREALMVSGRVGPGKDQSLGKDIQNLMRVAIAALKETPAITAPSSLNKLDKSNTGKDRQATDRASGGQGP